ncbi:hypothetical protein TrLO_g15120 [Triparma laevis f. longispina]|uniref:Uncharacterized protein n=1 Tax=Triparma laevis f. longispina TaxID=1714387 RepID=A0A9W7C9Z3_9STRA|nr:hypothetical protein TrLO_g15120 [Triparma laevis f. longispina]
MTFANMGCADPGCTDEECIPDNLKGYIREFKRRKIKVDSEGSTLSSSTQNFYGNLDALASSEVPPSAKQTRVVMHSGKVAKVNKIVLPPWRGDQKPVLEFCGLRDRFYVVNWREAVPESEEGKNKELKIELLGSGVVGTSEEMSSRTPLSTYGANACEVFHYKGSTGDNGLRAVGFVFGGDSDSDSDSNSNYELSNGISADIYVFKIVGPADDDDEVGSDLLSMMEGLEEGLVTGKRNPNKQHVHLELNGIITELEVKKKKT